VIKYFLKSYRLVLNLRRRRRPRRVLVLLSSGASHRHLLPWPRKALEAHPKAQRQRAHEDQRQSKVKRDAGSMPKRVDGQHGQDTAQRHPHIRRFVTFRRASLSSSSHLSFCLLSHLLTLPKLCTLVFSLPRLLHLLRVPSFISRCLFSSKAFSRIFWEINRFPDRPLWPW